MSYKSKLQQLAEEIDGCQAAFFCGYDGILIEKFEVKQDLSLEEEAAEWSSLLSKLMGDSNMLKEITATFSYNVISLKPLEDGFIGLVLSPDGNLGRAKFELNKCRSDFGQ